MINVITFWDHLDHVPPKTLTNGLHRYRHALICGFSFFAVGL